MTSLMMSSTETVALYDVCLFMAVKVSKNLDTGRYVAGNLKRWWQVWYWRI